METDRSGGRDEEDEEGGDGGGGLFGSRLIQYDHRDDQGNGGGGSSGNGGGGGGGGGVLTGSSPCSSSSSSSSSSSLAAAASWPQAQLVPYSVQQHVRDAITHEERSTGGVIGLQSYLYYLDPRAKYRQNRILKVPYMFRSSWAPRIGRDRRGG